MKVILFNLAIVFFVASIGVGLIQDFILSALGVPSISDIGEKFVTDMAGVNTATKEAGMSGINAARIVELIPWLLFLISIILFICTIICEQ